MLHLGVAIRVPAGARGLAEPRGHGDSGPGVDHGLLQPRGEVVMMILRVCPPWRAGGGGRGPPPWPRARPRCPGTRWR